MKINGVEVPDDLSDEGFNEFMKNLPPSGLSSEEKEEVRKTAQINFTIDTPQESIEDSLTQVETEI